MRKQIALFLCLVVFCTAAFCPLYVHAATPLDPAADASLTLHYQKEGQAFSELPINIYRVAEAFPDGTFELIEPFASYPVNIHNITAQEQWNHTAETLSSYIVANQLVPYRLEETDETGTVIFEHLETGLYLVREVVAENNTGTYVFNQFMVYVPSPQPDGSYNYEVEAKPKCTNFVALLFSVWGMSTHGIFSPFSFSLEISNFLLRSHMLKNIPYLWRVYA